MKNANYVINLFSDFLNKSWKVATLLLKGATEFDTEQIINDWVQANWELLVESTLLQAKGNLQVYGSGGDTNGISERMFESSERTIMYYIKTHNEYLFDYLSKTRVATSNMYFLNFVTLENDWYKVDCPFDYALFMDANRETEYVFRLTELNFILYKN